jgi:hypothetical protein
MVARAYEDLILSDEYSYNQFVRMVDKEIMIRATEKDRWNDKPITEVLLSSNQGGVHKAPVRAAAPSKPSYLLVLMHYLMVFWKFVPVWARPAIKKALGRG